MLFLLHQVTSRQDCWRWMSSSLFLLLTILVVLLDKWTHIAGTYDSATGKAKIYVNGELRNMTIGEGLLSRDWLSRAGIGDHKAARPLMGFIDEFRIYNYALPKADIEALSKMCLPGMPPSICYSLHINIFSFCRKYKSICLHSHVKQCKLIPLNPFWNNAKPLYRLTLLLQLR